MEIIIKKSWGKVLNILKKQVEKDFNFFFSAHHSNQMSEGSQVSKITIYVKILKRHSLTDSPRVGIELPGQLKMQKLPYSETKHVAFYALSWVIKTH